MIYTNNESDNNTNNKVSSCNKKKFHNSLRRCCTHESTIDSEGFKGGTRGAPIMPRDAVSRTANVERTGRIIMNQQ